MTRKICIVVTARPSYSRIKTALSAIDVHPELELQLVVAASALLERYGSAIEVIEQDGFEIAARVRMVLEGEDPISMAKTTGLGMLELSTTFDNLQPDFVITVADRYETISTALAAAYMNIPLVHIQGGEVTGSIDEKVRHAVTKLADLHLVSTEKAAERVIKMGEMSERVHVTGCPSIDLADEILSNPALDFDPYQKYGGVGDYPDLSNGYIVVLQHPVTTEYENSRSHVMETLYGVCQSEVPVLWFWPNVDAGSDGTSNGIRAFREMEKPNHMHFFKNMEPHDFLRLIYNSICLVGNSSVGIRESSYLGIPTVNIGTRQSGRERSHNVIDVDYNRKQISQAIDQHKKHGKHYMHDTLYGNGHAGHNIANILSSVHVTVRKRLTY
jgi:UDP-hydrolysing UDP-N-acetyl-D-glucosamine 2-epimerase